MSCDWNIRCVTCGETLTFDDANHRDDVMRALICHADAIANIAPLVAETGFMVELKTWWGDVDPAWFAKHRGHKLQPIDEYGRLDTQCHGNADCDAGHRHPCVLDAEHEGPHSARKP